MQERLGHSSIMLTLSVYSHTVPAMETAAAEQVASLIFGDEAKRPASVDH